MAAEAGTDGQRGRLLGHVHLAEDAYVQIHETVVVEGDNIHREKYAYLLSIAGDEIGGYERDPRTTRRSTATVLRARTTNGCRQDQSASRMRSPRRGST